ncbi:DMT family transporter [Streptomyces sp. NPDC047000]|uniref:DMT family transporter n=1 Tax=Streptomyces sp. NPDC047000 TaxID=3155474 RepID=UPI00340A2277
MAGNRTMVGAVCGTVTGLAWGGMFVVAKSAYGRLDPFHLTAVRFLFAASIFCVLLLLVEGKGAFRLEGRAAGLWLLSTVGFAGFNFCTYVGLEHIPAQSSALIMATMPLVTVLVMWARTRKAPPAVTLGLVVLALLGVAMVLGNGNPVRVLTGGLGYGGLLTLLGVVGWMTYTTGSAGYPGWSALRYTTLTCLLGTGSILVITLVATLAGWIPDPGPVQYVRVWWQILYVVIAATSVATLTWNTAFRKLGPSNGVLFINLVPITAFVIQAFRGHRPTVYEGIGVALVLVALFASNAYSRRRAAAEAARRGSVAAPVAASSGAGTAREADVVRVRAAGRGPDRRET